MLSLLLSSCVNYLPNPDSRNQPDNILPDCANRETKIIALNNSNYTLIGNCHYISSHLNVCINFFWHQMGQGCYKLLIFRPFGGTELILNVRKNMVELTDNQGTRYRSNDAGEMFYRFTGIHLPLDDLQNWLIGLPGKTVNDQMNSQCKLNRISYHSKNKIWKVTYKYPSNEDLPSYIKISDSRKNKIKIKIDRWIVK